MVESEEDGDCGVEAGEDAGSALREIGLYNTFVLLDSFSWLYTRSGKEDFNKHVDCFQT